MHNRLVIFGFFLSHAFQKWRKKMVLLRGFTLNRTDVFVTHTATMTDAVFDG